ncbi:MAG: FUSC family protein, partial [Bacteroidia bacterium]|nr:FUSC family protein [Bacteroidia bacterium]
STGHIKTQRLLMQMQVDLNSRQEIVRDVLFKTRYITKEISYKGSALLAITREVFDISEKINSIDHAYSILKVSDDGKVLEDLRKNILLLAGFIEETGMAVQGGYQVKSAEYDETFLLQEIEKVNDQTFKSGLFYIAGHIKLIYLKLVTLQNYTSGNADIKSKAEKISYDLFTSKTEFSAAQFINNLNPASNIFRHSLRVSVTMMAGYLLMKYLLLGHDYWILLTVLVILKPAYGLTKKRNISRLTGTAIGIVAGATILYFVHSQAALSVLMVLAMVCAYSIIRVNYFYFVAFMTVFLLVSFHFLYAGELNGLIKDRLLDTAIGSALAFIATFIYPPKWEKESIDDLSAQVLLASGDYFKTVTDFRDSKKSITDYKLARKHAYISAANLSGAYQRMDSEPVRRQHKIEGFYSLVVLNNLLLSHISALSHNINFTENKGLENYKNTIEEILEILSGEALPDKTFKKIFTEKSENENGVLNQLNNIYKIALQIRELRKEGISLKS